jgi:hypothetical protein
MLVRTLAGMRACSRPIEVIVDPLIQFIEVTRRIVIEGGLTLLEIEYLSSSIICF